MSTSTGPAPEASLVVDPTREAVPVGRASILALTIVSLLGLAMFAWPLLVHASPDNAQHVQDAPFIFMAILPALVVIVLAQVADGGIDTKALAMLGVLSAVNAALRPLGAGVAGIETVFFMLVLAGRVFGPGFGFTLGCTSIFASALITGGVGPWLPFQMLACAWVGLFAGLLPKRPRGRAEIVMLAAYGVVVAYAFGILMNLWFWPFLTSGQMADSALAYAPGAPLLENLKSFGLFTLLTSTGGWDTGRAITDVIAIAVLGPPVLVTLRRAARRAAFREPGAARTGTGAPG